MPIGWSDLARRTGREVLADNCPGLAAQLAYYFFLALFPALLFLVAIISFIPVTNLLDTITATLARVAPSDVLRLIQEQVVKIAQQKDGGLLTLGMLGTIWSTCSTPKSSTPRPTARTRGKTPGEKKKIGTRAEREWSERHLDGTFHPAIATGTCDIDRDLPPAPARRRAARASDWILGGVPLGAAVILAFATLRQKLERVRS